MSKHKEQYYLEIIKNLHENIASLREEFLNYLESEKERADCVPQEDPANPSD